MAVNARMKAARVLRGLTQLQLADKVGLREIEVSRIETGRTRPAPEVKRAIAAALGKSEIELFVE